MALGRVVVRAISGVLSSEQGAVGMWTCHNGPHIVSYGFAPYSRDHARLRDFIICLVSHNMEFCEFLWRTVGVLDADGDGDLLYWRWDFWNSNMKRMLREYRRDHV